MEERHSRLSRFLALVLRHQGPQMGLSFDEDGFTTLESLQDLLKRNEIFYWANLDDVRAVIRDDAKGRYEIRDDKIRALYGHSEAIPVKYEETEPLEKLYHGTSTQATREIEKTGILPSGRRYVHLSIDQSTAHMVALRHTTFPIILEIDAAQAFKDGIKFHRPSKHIFLTDKIPPKYLRVCDVRHRPAPASAPDAARGPGPASAPGPSTGPRPDRSPRPPSPPGPRRRSGPRDSR